MRKICLLGASGSIGTQTIDVMSHNVADFTLVGFSIGHQTRKIAPLIKKYPNVSAICLAEKTSALRYSKKYPNIKFFYGDDGLIQLIDNCPCDMVVNSLVGFVGLLPTIHSLKKNF